MKEQTDFFSNKVEARSLQHGVIYGSTVAGEFQKDQDGTIYWKKVTGEIQEINPDPSALFYVIRKVGDETK